MKRFLPVAFVALTVGATIAFTPLHMPAPQEQECYEVGEIECVNTSAGWIATWPMSQAFRDHIVTTIDGLELSDQLSLQQYEFWTCPVFTDD